MDAVLLAEDEEPEVEPLTEESEELDAEELDPASPDPFDVSPEDEEPLSEEASECFSEEGPVFAVCESVE